VPKFRIYELPIAKLTSINEYDPPAGVAIYHLSTFADIGNSFDTRLTHRKWKSLDADGELEHLLPVCMDSLCIDSRIYVRDDNSVSDHCSINIIVSLNNNLVVSIAD
jgi:hypothetical protein